MSSISARIFFCVYPAALFGLAIGITTQSLVLAMIASAAMFGLGWQVTAANPSRGEGQ